MDKGVLLVKDGGRFISFNGDGDTGYYQNRGEVPDIHGTKFIIPDTFKAEWVAAVKLDGRVFHVKVDENKSGKVRTCRLSLRSANAYTGVDITQDHKLQIINVFKAKVPPP